MGVSRGQCCDTCVTTRAYNPNGNEVWSRNFGTDTIDLYSSGDSVFLIGNDELAFQYLKELKVTNPSGQKETYVIPLKTFIYNNSNFVQYNINGRFENRDNFLEFESEKDQDYTRSFDYVETSGGITTVHGNELSNLYSYPFEKYTRASNTATARIFADNSGVYIVRPNNIFYYMNSGNDYHLKNIGFIGAEYKIPSYESGRIYVGGEKYCHGAIDFIDRFEFQSGSPISGTIEKFNILYNYEPNYSGIVSGTGTIGTLAFHYFDNNNNRDEINFVFRKDKAYVRLLGSGCGYKSVEVSDVQQIYRGTGILIDEQEYDDEDNPIHPNFSIYDSVWLNRHHYSGDFSSAILCNGSGQMTHAWNVTDYIVDTGNGRISFALEKVINESQDSGCDYFRYDSSSFTGLTYPVSGTGIINGYFAHYDTTGLRSSIEQFAISDINNQYNLTGQLNLIQNIRPDIDFSSLSDTSGNVSRYSQNVGTWNINNIDLEYHQEDDYFLSKINNNISIQDNSVDYQLTRGMSQNYGLSLLPFANLYSVASKTDIDIIRSCRFDIIPCVFVTGVIVRQDYTLYNSGNCSYGPATDIEFLSHYTKYGTYLLTNIDYFVLESTYTCVSGFSPSSTVNFVYLKNIATYCDYYVPTVFSAIPNLVGSLSSYIDTGYGTIVPYVSGFCDPNINLYNNCSGSAGGLGIWTEKDLSSLRFRMTNYTNLDISDIAIKYAICDNGQLFSNAPFTSGVKPAECLHQIQGCNFDISGNLFQNTDFHYAISPIKFNISGNQFYNASGGYFYIEGVNNWSLTPPSSTYIFATSGSNDTYTYNNDSFALIDKSENNVTILPYEINNKRYRY